jgi:hypothetical protein
MRNGTGDVKLGRVHQIRAYIEARKQEAAE